MNGTTANFQAVPQWNGPRIPLRSTNPANGINSPLHALPVKATSAAHRQGLKFALQRTQRALARENYLRPSKTDSGPFLDAFSPLNKNKGGADAAGNGGQRPQRGSIRRAEGSDRGSSRLPAGDGCARRRRRQAGAPFLSSLLGFPPPEALKAFFKVKNARARYGLWKAYGYWPAWPLLQVK